MVYTDYEWDFGKALTNVIKHGVLFELAITIFDDPNHRIEDDPLHSSRSETRYEEGLLLVIVTLRKDDTVCRIISARKANQRERKHYEAQRR